MRNLGLTIFALLFSVVISQGQEMPVEISPFIGDKLDRVERDYLNLFLKFEEFEEAEFYLNPDSTLQVNIVYEKDGVFRDTVLNNYRNLKQIQMHIENFIQFQINDIEKQDRGKFATCTLKDSSKTFGELLSVRSTSVLFLSVNPDTNKRNKNNMFQVETISENEIDRIKFRGSSWNLAYIIYPVVGILAGMAIGASLEEDEKWETNVNFETGKGKISPSPKIWATLAGGLLGGLLGVVVSFALPIEIGSDNVFETPFSEDDIEGLRDYARYNNYEPYYLKKIK